MGRARPPTAKARLRPRVFGLMGIQIDMTSLQLQIEDKSSQTSATIDVSTLVIAGWAGRDRAAIEHHIEELAALGVPRPAQIPTYYRAAAARLTTSGYIEVVGEDSSGEVEPVIIASGGKMYVGIGSDHTDRKLETHGITLSKQICEKPISSTFWPFEEVENHWDSLVLRSYAIIDGKRELYQDGTTAALLPPLETIKGFADSGRLADGTVMFGGTIPAIGGIRPGTRFEAELHDPVLGRTIKFAYDVKTLQA